ncbi:MAG: metal-dependent transcriptional regulator [Nanoarchaeota archaeon]|nr:metal-dependent transcriptional regulator [Nanoarchaeota archaeon]
MKHISKEDYLRTIYELHSQHGVRVVDIAKKLDINKASVSEMIRKLANEKLLTIKPYSPIHLTYKGKQKAKALVKKHNIVKKFAKRILNHDDETAHNEAHKLEHAFSHDSIQKLEDFLYGRAQIPPDYVG